MRRSCEIAASMRVRSWTKRCRRACMRLKARVVSRTSAGPRSGTGGTASPRPSRSAATASSAIGRVSRRTMKITITESATAMTPIDTSPGIAQSELGGGRRVPTFSHWPSSSCAEITRLGGRRGWRQRRSRGHWRSSSRTWSRASSRARASASPTGRISARPRRSPAPPVAPPAVLVAPVDQHLLDPDAGEVTGQHLLQAVVVVLGIRGVDRARIGEPKAQQRRAGGAQDRLVQLSRRVLEQPDDRGRAREDLQPVRPTARPAAARRGRSRS